MRERDVSKEWQTGPIVPIWRYRQDPVYRPTEAYHSKACFFASAISFGSPMKMSYLRMMKYEQCFSPFSAVSLWGVAGLAETFPSFTVRGPSLPYVSGFHVPPDSIFPPQLRSSSRALHRHLHFHNYSGVFCCMSSIDVLEPFQHLCFHTISSFLRCSNRLTPIAHRTIHISVVAIRF